ncbi:MAG: TolC family protein [Planctomycetales bacterium]|nr:TolC family protein [Planctomycetales bacterium]
MHKVSLRLGLCGFCCLLGCASSPRLQDEMTRISGRYSSGGKSTQAIAATQEAPKTLATLAESPTASISLVSFGKPAEKIIAGHGESVDPKSELVPDNGAGVVARATSFYLEDADSSPSDEVHVDIPEDRIEVNLPSVLSMVDGQSPVVAQTRWQVQQAYARVAEAESLWLPSIQAGFSFHRHDGNYQASNGAIVDVNRNSFQYGLGTGAVGAGTTPRPGIVAQFHLADAIFSPRISNRSAWASSHAAGATLNAQLLSAGLAYLELVDAYQALRVIERSNQRYKELETITTDFAETGQGLRSDADRMNTEVALSRSRLVSANEKTQSASANLAKTISIDYCSSIVPLDTFAVPLEITTSDCSQALLISTALASRPELRESQALVALACEAYRREKFAPLTPSVLVGFSTSGFGGGIGSSLNNIDGRYDLDALMAWQVRNLGFGEKAILRQRSAQIQQAQFKKIEMMDQVAYEVREAFSQVQSRSQQVEITGRAIESAQNSFRRNLERIRDGEGLPIEVLQSIQALENAEHAYREAVWGFNQAQLRLQWAQGWPINGSEN